MYGITSEQDERIDWGKTAKDYATHRPGPPPSFYRRLQALGIGLPGQRTLDLGTGTGVIARTFAQQGCEVAASDIAAKQIKMAQTLAEDQGLSISWQTAAAEHTRAEDDSLDVVTANQCFLYFDTQAMTKSFSNG